VAQLIFWQVSSLITYCAANGNAAQSQTARKGLFMSKVQDGNFVQVHYTGTLENGDVFDTSKDRGPLEFQMGSGQIIPGFEQHVRGMAVNETKSFSLPPEQAYGQRDEGLLREFPRSQTPEGFDPQVGQTVALMTEQGQQIPATVTEATSEKVVVDLNHPLAGKTLKFEVTVEGFSDEPTQSGCGSCSDPGGCGGHDSGGCGCGGHDSGGCGCGN
jgi:peptidylprolyl isomerase